MVAIFCIFLLSLLGIIRMTYRKNNLPPGPWFRLPVVGHIPFLGSNPSVTFMQWSSTYGPVISIQLGSFSTVVINDGRILKQAFSSTALAGRPRMKTIDDMSQRKGFAFCDGPHAREQRRFALKTLRDVTNPSKLAEGLILDEANDLIQTLDETNGKSTNVHHLFHRNAINPLLNALISQRFEPDDPQFVRIAHTIASALHLRGVLPVLGAFIPTLCSYFPNAVSLNTWVNLRTVAEAFFRPHLQQRSATAIPGQPRDIMDVFAEKMTGSKDDPSSSFHDVRNIEATFRDILGAAMDTTSSQLEWIVHYMAKYPAVQEKLAEEINSHFPCNCLPSISDNHRLPYTAAVIHETLRISLTARLGLFHSALEDTTIAGYQVPKGTLVIGNLHGIHNNPQVWDSPHEFRPERFITKDGTFSVGDKPLFPFGAGSRSCAGAAYSYFLDGGAILERSRMLQRRRIRGLHESGSNMTYLNNKGLHVPAHPEKSLDEMLFNVFVAVQNEHGQRPCYYNSGFKNLKFFD